MRAIDRTSPNMAERAQLSFRAFVAWVISAILLMPGAAWATDLTIYLEKQGAALHVRAVSAFDTSVFSIEPKSGIIQKLVEIYDLIERRPEAVGALDKVGAFMGKQYRTVRGLIPFWKNDDQERQVESTPAQVETLDRLLNEAGRLLFGPIDNQMAIARRVMFVVAEDCLYYPFDALHVDGTPLFLKKPIAYSLNRPATSTIKASSSWRGLIIADSQNDPQKGADTITRLFPGAFEFDAQRVQQADISEISSVDFVLISADGGVDGFKLENLMLRPETLSRLRPEMVYFDCNLYGMNLNFLNHFSHTGVSTYVAPIFSRKSGNASAQTMIRFFRSMLSGEQPSRALYLARKTLYDAYRLDRSSPLVAMRGAFPFRVYQLK